MTTVARIETFPLAYPEPNDRNRQRHVTLVRVESTDGCVGWGECITQLPETGAAVKLLIERALSSVVIGMDPEQPQNCYAAMEHYGYWHGRGGILSFAISAIDMAVWDIAGKLAGAPVSALLDGGAVRTELPACASTIFNTTDIPALQEQYARYAARGYTFVKGGWGLEAAAGFGCDEARDLEVVAAMREAVGDDVAIAVDVSFLAGWDAQHASHMAQRLAEFDLDWLEDALPHYDVEGWAQLRKVAPMPLVTGERCWTVSDYERLAGDGSVDRVLMDPGRVQGVTGMYACARAAAQHGVGVIPHSWSSAVNTAAALHVLAVAPTTYVFELKPEPSPMQNELVKVPFDMLNGQIAVPTGPGLGVEIDESAVRRYAAE